MPRTSTAAVLLAVCAGSGCHTYTPAPVDLAEHARAFAARLDEAKARLAAVPGAAGAQPFDLADGIDRREAHRLALWFQPECRLARLRAGVAEVARDEAGRWLDPTLDVDAARILETVAHPWLVAARIGLTLPLSGRLQAERDLAAARHDAAWIDARLCELDAVQQTDTAFAAWSAAQRQRDLLVDLCAALRELEAIAAQLATAGERTQQEARAFTLERLLREAELQQAEHEAAAGELMLKRRLGLHPAAAVTFVPDAGATLRVPSAAERAARLADGPRLWRERAAYATAEHTLALAVARQWPDLGLAPGWQEEDAQPRAALGGSLPLPLFAGNTAAIRTAEAERAAAAEALRAASEAALHELAAAELELTAAERQRDLVAGQLLPLAEQQVADVRRLAELGQLEPLLLLDALVRAHAAGLQAIRSERAAADAAIRLNHLFWDQPPAAPHEEAR